MKKCKDCDKVHDKKNTGCENSGHWNSGNRNSGHWNSGHWNSGDMNSGNMNSGNWNSGNRNSGDRNSGDRNSGHWNSGDWNSGHWNSGDMNSGNMNSGNRNSGDRNSGHWNSGDRNSGHWNSGDMNSGNFNTDSPDKVRIFNTWVEMTHEEFNSKYNIYADLPLNRWKNYEQMEEQEKKDFPFAKDIGGYLKTLDFKEACQIWWDEHEGRHNDFLSLPNFDATIFEEITGIKVNQSKEQYLDIIELNGKKYKLLED